MSQNGKGDTQRPCDKKQFDANYEKIFGKKNNSDISKQVDTIEEVDKSVV